MKNYIREHLSKGYSRKAVKRVLMDYGYEGSYIDSLLRKHNELRFVKIYSVFASILLIISIFSYNLILFTNQNNKISSFATLLETGNEGCCISICMQTSRDDCYGRFVENKKCNEVEECNVGCCIDKEGYCLTNYLYGNCLLINGTHINRDCNDITFCTNITEKYLALQYKLNKRGEGIVSITPFADYYGSSFNIKYYVYDKSDIVAIEADLKENAKTVDSLALYDDGSHNDGVINDNIYGNNWLSSNLQYFEGFKQLYVGINVKFRDGAQHLINKNKSIVVLNKNKCLPIYNEFNKPDERNGLIFVAYSYELNDGYPKYVSDVANFLSILFSAEPFASSKDNFNVFRHEESLSYTSIPTIVSIVSNSCPSYNNRKDLIITLDNYEDYCINEDTGMVRVNPQILLYKNISNNDIGTIFNDFCSYVATPKKIAEEIISFAMPPKIEVYTLNNVNYNITMLHLSFSISAYATTVSTKVSLNSSLIADIMFNKANIYNISLNLSNGTNVIDIEANDANDNLAFYQLLINTTIE